MIYEYFTGVSIMYKKITTILATSLLLGGCMSHQSTDNNVSTHVSGTEPTKFVQFSMIKLYAQSNIDSSIIIDNVNKELSKGKTVDAVLSSYGTYFTDIKLNIGTLNNIESTMTATTTTAHVAKITPKDITPGYYNTGVVGSIKLKQLDDNKYIVDYKIKNIVLKKLDVSPQNKLITMPDVQTKNFEQSLVVEENVNMASGITNPEPKQYELFIIKVSTKGEE